MWYGGGGWTGKWAYRAKVLVLHFLELGIGVAGAQLYISQHHLEDSVVDGLGEVHVQLIHGRLRRKKKNRNERGMLSQLSDHFYIALLLFTKASIKKRKVNQY